jgi:hypothetical protein
VSTTVSCMNDSIVRHIDEQLIGAWTPLNFSSVTSSSADVSTRLKERRRVTTRIYSSLNDPLFQASSERCTYPQDAPWGDVGSAWLPECHLRSLPMDLSRFIAGVWGVRQTVNPAMTSSQQHPEALEVHPHTYIMPFWSLHDFVHGDISSDVHSWIC